MAYISGAFRVTRRPKEMIGVIQESVKRVKTLAFAYLSLPAYLNVGRTLASAMAAFCGGE